MTDLAENFTRKEFACKCGCCKDTVDAELLAVLVDLRGHFDAPVSTESANRCPVHNKRVGGAVKSQHLTGKAYDAKVKGIDPDEVADYLEGKYPGRYGIGRYDTFTHIDVRAVEARWDMRG